MGKVISRFTMIARRFQVSPEQLATTNAHSHHHHIQGTDDFSVNNTTDILVQSVKHLRNEPVENHDSGKDDKLVKETSEPSQHVTVTQNQQEGIKRIEFGHGNLGMDSENVWNFCCHGESGVANGKTAWFEAAENFRTEDPLYTTKPDPCGTDDRAEISFEEYHTSPGNSEVVFATENSHTDETPSSHGDSFDDNDGFSLMPNDHQRGLEFHQVQSDETLKEISADTCSTEGTAGSEDASFKEVNYSSHNDTINETLSSENFMIEARVDVKCNPSDLETPGRITLTPRSLETLNCCELDRREYVQHFIQAWEPSDQLSCVIGGLETKHCPTTAHCSQNSETDETLYRNGQELHKPPRIQHDDDNFAQRSSEKVFKSSSNYCVDCRRERAPWLDAVSADSDDEDMCGWSARRGISCPNDSSNRLTLCSLSTINEESDDDKEPNICTRE